MSTIKSSAEDLTLNADGSNEVKFQINAVEKASINSSGLFTSTTIDATALTGNLPAISGASLTGMGYTDAGVATTASGSSTVISGIPAGTQHLMIIVNKVSTGGANQIQVQLGDAGGLENSGYVSANFRIAGSSVSNIVGTSYFIIGNGASAGDSYTTVMHIHRSATGVHDWVASWVASESTADIGWGSGSKTLTADLTQVALQTNGTFDAGGFNVYYQ